MAPAIWHQPLKEPSPWSWLNEGVGGYGRAGTPSASPGLHQGAPLALLWQSGEALGEANGPEPASITGLHRTPCVCIWRPCSASAHSFSKIIHLHAIHCTKPAFKTQKMRSLPPVFPPSPPLPHSNPRGQHCFGFATSESPFHAPARPVPNSQPTHGVGGR